MIVVPHRHFQRPRRGMSLLELMIALLITTVIAGAIASMMGAVVVGVRSRRDGRQTMVRAAAAANRLEAYIAPSRCILDSTAALPAVLWFNDDRESNTVHATELRWIEWDAKTGELLVAFVSFPDDWSQIEQDLEDNEYAASADWAAVLAAYDANSWIVRMPIVEGLADASVYATEKDIQSTRHLIFELEFETSDGAVDIPVGATIRLHSTPDV